MDVTSVAAQPAVTPSATQTRAAGLSSDFETFLKMLTAQMRNQDPLNPIESADFAVQLATFSTVEQQVLTNDLLSDLGSQLSTLGMAQLSGWVGMEARAHMPVAFDGSAVDVGVIAAPGADRAELVAYDSLGAVVSRQTVPASSGQVAWTGRNSNGTPLAAGSYTLTMVSYAGEAEIGRNPAEVSGQIAEARNEAGQTVLIMQDGQRVQAGDVLSLRAASS